MKIILDYLFEFIVMGASEISCDKKVPLLLRIIAGIVLIAACGGLIGICFYSGIHERSWLMLVLGFITLGFTVIGAYGVYRKYK